MASKLVKTGSALSFAVTGLLCSQVFGPISLIPFGVVAIHEFGHYWAGICSKAEKVNPPLILPLGPLLIGLTYVESSPKPAFVSLSGPLFGIAASLTALVGSIVLALPLSYILMSTVMLAYEALALFVSSDANKAFNDIRSL